MTTTTAKIYEVATVANENLMSEFFVKQQVELLSLQEEVFNNKWFLIGGGVCFVIIFVILLSYKLKYRNAIIHPPHIQCLLFIFSSLSSYLSRNNPNPSGLTQSMINFLTNTIASLLTPPTPTLETGPTALAPSTIESSGEELLSIVIDASAVGPVPVVAPTTDRNDEAFLSVVDATFFDPPSPTFSLISSGTPSFSDSFAHLDLECQAAYFDRCM